jgi:hypothetical protein
MSQPQLEASRKLDSIAATSRLKRLQLGAVEVERSSEKEGGVRLARSTAVVSAARPPSRRAKATGI